MIRKKKKLMVMALAVVTFVMQCVLVALILI